MNGSDISTFVIFDRRKDQAARGAWHLGRRRRWRWLAPRLRFTSIFLLTSFKSAAHGRRRRRSWRRGSRQRRTWRRRERWRGGVGNGSAQIRRWRVTHFYHGTACTHHGGVVWLFASFTARGALLASRIALLRTPPRWRKRRAGRSGAASGGISLLLQAMAQTSMAIRRRVITYRKRQVRAVANGGRRQHWRRWRNGCARLPFNMAKSSARRASLRAGIAALAAP